MVGRFASAAQRAVVAIKSGMGAVRRTGRSVKTGYKMASSGKGSVGRTIGLHGNPKAFISQKTPSDARAAGVSFGKKVHSGVQKVRRAGSAATSSSVGQAIKGHMKKHGGKYTVGGLVAGAGAVAAGSHIASYKVNQRRARQGKGPSYMFGGISGTAGYRSGMKKRTK